VSRITVDPGQMGGAPCIRGLRILVSTIARMLNEHVSPAEILRFYPDLEPADLAAVAAWWECQSGCSCTPGVPRPPPGETWRDLVDVDGMSPDESALVQRAAEAALAAGIEPGIRRARWIAGWLAGYKDCEKYTAP
jgi:uncharacterized protein (DUF433 family)